jgi:hypothetical protein
VDASDGWLAFIASRPVLMILLGILAVLMGLVFRQRMVMRRYVLPQQVTDKE